MILVYRFLNLFIKLFLLFIIIAFERVVGLPILFLTVTISLMLLAQSVSRYLLFVFAAFVLAIFYQQAFVLSLIILCLFYFGFVLGSQVIESNLQRFIALLLLSTVIILFASGIEFHFWIFVQVLVSLVVSSFLLVRFLFTSYGFLGKKGTARQSFFK